MIEKLDKNWTMAKVINTINDILEIIDHLPQEKDLRKNIADVLGTELPWTEEDLLDFADKIIKVIGDRGGVLQKGSYDFKTAERERSSEAKLSPQRPI